MNRPVVGSAVVAAVLSLFAASSMAADGIKPSKAVHASSKAAAKGAASEVAEAVSPEQLAVAERVLTGEAQCEFNQQVSVQRIADKPGHFKVGFKSANYTMVPEVTTTGAVRLEDKRAGVVWVQIPAKSMLLNAKLGQRMVDACQQKEQRAGL